MPSAQYAMECDASEEEPELIESDSEDSDSEESDTVTYKFHVEFKIPISEPEEEMASRFLLHIDNPHAVKFIRNHVYEVKHPNNPLLRQRLNAIGSLEEKLNSAPTKKALEALDDKEKIVGLCNAIKAIYENGHVHHFEFDILTQLFPHEIFYIIGTSKPQPMEKTTKELLEYSAGT